MHTHNLIDKGCQLVFNCIKEKGEEKMKKLLNKKGFTLIELIVVIAILAVLALILVPSITGYIGRAQAARNQANARAEFSRVVLEAWTTEGSPLERDGTTPIVSEAEYELDDDLDCTVTFVGVDVSAFECTDGTDTWSKANDFNP